MPRYGFHCQSCSKKFRKYISYQEYGSEKVVCPFCESKDLKRLIDKVRFQRSEESKTEDLDSMFSNPEALESLEKDPQAMGRMMRKMSSEMGEELGPEFDEVVDRLEKGQSPEEIETSMPDLAGGTPGGDDIIDV